MADREILISSKLLTANHIAAANRLMKQSFPSLQDTHYLAVKGEWNSDVDGCVQIIFLIGPVRFQMTLSFLIPCSLLPLKVMIS